MKESLLRTLEALVALTATYMAAVTMVQTTLYNKLRRAQLLTLCSQSGFVLKARAA